MIVVPCSSLYAANCVRSHCFASLFIRLCSKQTTELSSKDERTEDPLFQPDARKVPGIKGARITVLNNLVLMSLIAQDQINF